MSLIYCNTIFLWNIFLKMSNHIVCMCILCVYTHIKQQLGNIFNLYFTHNLNAIICTKTTSEKIYWVLSINGHSTLSFGCSETCLAYFTCTFSVTYFVFKWKMLTLDDWQKEYKWWYWTYHKENNGIIY